MAVDGLIYFDLELGEDWLAVLKNGASEVSMYGN